MSRFVPSRTTQEPTERLEAAPGPDRWGPERRAPEPSEPGRYVLVEAGEDIEQVKLAPGVTRVGRGYAADLRIEDQSVSRRHAILVSRPAGLRVLDDRSFNGTFVNGRRVSQADLQDGDVVVLGRVVLLYRNVTADALARRPVTRADRVSTPAP